MSTICRTPAATRDHPSDSLATAFAVTLKRWCVAFVTWRVEQAAIAHLCSKSDWELKDIGLTRSEITGAVRSKAMRHRRFSHH